MKAIQVTCPNCGAKLKVDEASSLVTCEYCGTASTIQRRTRILERVVPPASTERPAIRGAVRYARQQHSSRWIAAIVAIPILIGCTAAIFGVRKAMQHREDVKRRIDQQMARARAQIDEAMTKTGAAASAASAAASDGLSWQGTSGVLIADVDGDGTPELIGRGRRVNAGDTITLIALDVATGARKWESVPLGTYSDTYRGLLALVRDTIVYVSEKAQLRAFHSKDGTPAWGATLDERVKAFCRAPEDGTFIAVGNDDVWRTIAVADGSVRSSKPGPKQRSAFERPACTELPDDATTPYEKAKQPGHSSPLAKKLGLRVDSIVGGPGGRIVNGTRASGTAVTTLVAVDDKGAEKWRATGAAETLAAEGPARYIAVGPDQTCFLYYSTEYRFACLALADGRRLWDAEAPATFEGLYIVPPHLVVTTHRQLEVRDLATGAIRWSLE